MKLNELPRTSLYVDRCELDDFVMTDGVLVHAMHEVFLKQAEDVCDELALFNEAHYIATVAMCTPFPNLHVREWKRKVWNSMGERQFYNNMGDDMCVQLVMSMVYVLLCVQDSRTTGLDRAVELMKKEDYGQSRCFAAFAALTEVSGLYHADLRPNTFAAEIVQETEAMVYSTDDVPPMMAIPDLRQDAKSSLTAPHRKPGYIALREIVKWANEETSSFEEAKTIKTMVYDLMPNMTDEEQMITKNIGYCHKKSGPAINKFFVENKFAPQSCTFNSGSTMNGNIGRIYK